MRISKKHQRIAEEAAKKKASGLDLETELPGTPFGPAPIAYHQMPLTVADYERALKETMGYPALAAGKLHVPVQQVVDALEQHPELLRFRMEYQRRCFELAEIKLFSKAAGGDMKALQLLVGNKHKMAQVHGWNENVRGESAPSAPGVNIHLNGHIDDNFGLEQAARIAARRFASASAASLGPAAPVIDAEGSLSEDLSHGSEPLSDSSEVDILEVRK